MAKAQTKTEMAIVEEDPRVRMKEIRTIVSNALKKNQRIDLMDFSERDRTRVIVALQDEVMHSRGRHKKATAHIAESKQIYGVVEGVVSFTLEGMGAMVQAQAQHIEALEASLEAAGNENMMLNMEIQASHGQISDLAGRLDTMKAAVKEFT